MVISASSGRGRIAKGAVVAASAAALLAAAPVAGAHGTSHHGRGQGGWQNGQGSQLAPNSVLISGTQFPRQGVNVQVGQQLPFITSFGTDGAPNTYATAVADGQYPYVFNNDSSDGSFAVNTPIDLWDVGFNGQPLGTVQVPTNQMTTSFSSKSELAINLATNGQSVSFSGYNAVPGALDVSNSSTPGTPDPTNPDVTGPYYRVAGDLSSDGRWTFTDTNSYSGDNGRAALLDSADNVFFAAGNSNNGSSSPVLPGLVAGTGAQAFPESFLPQSQQNPAADPNIVPMGSFSINTLAAYATHKADKPGKDTNFRGLTVYNNVVYYTKGSGSNGINTVYFVDTSGSACPQGIGLPAANATLPSAGVTYQMCVLKGFSTALAKPLTTDPGDTDTTGGYPFGLWFANPDTLYVADEGSGDNTYDASSNSYPNADISGLQYPAGLQKWVFDQTTQQWNLAYTLQAGLNLGQPYTVPGYPTGDNSVTGLPWAPATDGLRNISGRVNGNGTVTVYATTSTVSGGGDQGADPNKVVAITDRLNATSPSPNEQFMTVRPATYGVRYGGVTVLPWNFGHDNHWGHQNHNRH